MCCRGLPFWIVFLICLALPRSALTDMVGASASDFTLKDLEGNGISLSQFQGKTVMIFHFNVYCHTCQEEVPLINQIQREHKELQVIGIAIGSDSKEVHNFKNNFRAEFLLVPDPQKEVFKKYFVTYVPLIDIIDTTGTIRYRGPLRSHREFKSIIKQMIEEKKAVGAQLWNNPPDFTLTDTQGDTYRLQDRLGEKTVLLTFINIHDETVRQVIEIMKALYNKYRREDLN